MELIKPIDCPYYLVSRTSLMITSVLKKGFISAGVEQVKPAYLGVLMSLWRHEDLKDKSSQINSRTEIKTNELAQMAGLEPSTMTGLLDRMEHDALIIRKAAPDDRRAQHISLTEKGHTVREAVLKVVDQTLAEVFKNTSEKDLESTKDTLRKVLLNNKEV